MHFSSTCKHQVYFVYFEIMRFSCMICIYRSIPTTFINKKSAWLKDVTITGQGYCPFGAHSPLQSALCIWVFLISVGALELPRRGGRGGTTTVKANSTQVSPEVLHRWVLEEWRNRERIRTGPSKIREQKRKWHEGDKGQKKSGIAKGSGEVTGTMQCW